MSVLMSVCLPPEGGTDMAPTSAVVSVWVEPDTDGVCGLRFQAP